MKAARFLIATCAIFAGGVVGHAFGSGSFSVGNSHFIFLILIAFAAALLSSSRLEGPKLAIVIALAQFGTHFFFSTSGHAELKMAISHLFFAIISYQVVTHLDGLLILIDRLFTKVIFKTFKLVKPFHLKLSKVSKSAPISIASQFAQDIARRGPPLIAA